MRINTYLAVLVCVSLVGGTALEYLLSEKFDATSDLSKAHSRSLLWQKDFQRVNADIGQYLITTDLVLASGQTYLSNGALRKGKIITSELVGLATTNHLLPPDAQQGLTVGINSIISINGMIERITLEGLGPNGLAPNDLLSEYDFIAGQISYALSDTHEQLIAEVDRRSEQLASAEADMRRFFYLVQFAFAALVLISWFWASRTIVKPIRKLNETAQASGQGNEFVGVSSGPQEIIELSDSFSSLTQSLSFQANHDPLTKLYNRRAFSHKMNALLDEFERENMTHVLCFIDLDHFKVINDTCGHSAGDEMLRRIAGILSKHSRESDLVARLGGDEFALLLYRSSIREAKIITQNILQAILNFEYKIDNQKFRVGASIGLTEVNAVGENLGDILNSADVACMQAKQSGRNTIIIFDSCMDLLQKQREEAIKVCEIKAAIEENRFELYRQDIVKLQPTHNDGKHYEILLRMRNADGQIESPAVFMPLIEHYRMGQQVDCWVVSAVIDWLVENPAELDALSTCSINLSGQSVGGREAEQCIVDKIKHHEFPAHKLCFEITETAAITDINKANSFIENLRKLGCQFALDDFGSGLSSFAYLKSLQVDYIKIDGVFVKDMIRNNTDIVTVKAINDVAKVTNKETIAEFVEDKETAVYLAQLGVSYAQGYYFDKPKPLKAMEHDGESLLGKPAIRSHI